MNRIAIFATAVAIAAVPAAIGLAGNASFAQGASVRVPAQAVLLGDDGSSPSAEPGDDRSSTPSATPSSTPSASRSASATPDDKGGETQHAEPGDDKGGDRTASSYLRRRLAPLLEHGDAVGLGFALGRQGWRLGQQRRWQRQRRRQRPPRWQRRRLRPPVIDRTSRRPRTWSDDTF